VLSKQNRFSYKGTKKSATKTKRKSGRYVSVVLFKQSTSNPTFTFVVSSKFFSDATTRNFIKRRARHIIKKHLPSIKSGNYFFYFKKNIDKLPFKEIEKEIVSLIKLL